MTALSPTPIGPAPAAPPAPSSPSAAELEPDRFSSTLAAELAARSSRRESPTSGHRSSAGQPGGGNLRPAELAAGSPSNPPADAATAEKASDSPAAKAAGAATDGSSAADLTVAGVLPTVPPAPPGALALLGTHAGPATDGTPGPAAVDEKNAIVGASAAGPDRTSSGGSSAAVTAQVPQPPGAPGVVAAPSAPGQSSPPQGAPSQGAPSPIMPGRPAPDQVAAVAIAPAQAVSPQAVSPQAAPAQAAPAQAAPAQAAPEHDVPVPPASTDAAAAMSPPPTPGTEPATSPARGGAPGPAAAPRPETAPPAGPPDGLQPVAPTALPTAVAAGVVASAAAGVAASLAADADAAVSEALATGGLDGAKPASPLSGLQQPESVSLSGRSAAALPSHIAELARMARVSADGTARLVVRLDPPELGAVTLHLTSRGSEVQLAMRAETPAGAAALAGQQARVRDLLAAHGFDLARFTVSGSDSTSQSDSSRAGRDAPGGDPRSGPDRPGSDDFASPSRQPGGRTGTAAANDGSGSRGSNGQLDDGSTTGPDERPEYLASTAATEGMWL
jgi:flagellar hook-length control protein FliK